MTPEGRPLAMFCSFNWKVSSALYLKDSSALFIIMGRSLLPLMFKGECSFVAQS